MTEDEEYVSCPRCKQLYARRRPSGVCCNLCTNFVSGRVPKHVAAAYILYFSGGCPDGGLALSNFTRQLTNEVEWVECPRCRGQWAIHELPFKRGCVMVGNCYLCNDHWSIPAALHAAYMLVFSQDEYTIHYSKILEFKKEFYKNE